MKTATKKTNPGNSSTANSEYFLWLCHRINRRHNGDESRKLASLLHSIGFKPLVPNDDNRMEDGIALKDLFYKETGTPEGSISEPEKCSVLEMMIALASRIDSIMSLDNCVDGTADWFWEMLENLKLKSDRDDENRKIVEDFVDRDYSPNGRGGLFPLKKPRKDQRTVEIWYQMMAYLEENYPD